MHELPPVPAPVRALIQTLRDAGHEAWLVGGCVRDLAGGREPGDFDVATSAGATAVLSLFPRAVPIGVRHGTVMVPSAAGPVDVTSFRAGPSLEDDLGHRDFTINAMAWDPVAGELVDPFDGRGDLAKGVLRAVRSAHDRLGEDPLRALRAARLAAHMALDVDPEVERAMREVAGSLRRLPQERVRRELASLLLAPAAGAGLALLRRTGIEAELLPGAAEDAPAVVEALPADLELRLAAWLRGANAAAILRWRRFPRRTSESVVRLLRLHPIEAGVDADSPIEVRRLLRRTGERDALALMALREAELRHGRSARSGAAAEARDRLAALRDAIGAAQRESRLALQRADLALDGRSVMEHLGCRPGPTVGEALRFLTEQVVDDPTRNTPEALRALLDDWSRSRA